MATQPSLSPQFDRYLKRDIKELVVPPVKKRKKRENSNQTTETRATIQVKL